MIEKEGNITNKVARLSKSSLDYNEIAQILGISPPHAAKELSIIKKEKQNVKKAKKSK
jgi:DNA-binding CsgD family transcriptional regulator